MTLTLILTLTLALPPSPTLILTRYKLEESASMGGLNLVKLALDMKTERRVALKFMGVKDDFVREVSFLKQLRSEYVVELIDYYEDPNDKQHCVVLEYGSLSLADYLKKGTLQRNERKFVVDRLAHIVQHLHANNVARRDIKRALAPTPTPTSTRPRLWPKALPLPLPYRPYPYPGPLTRSCTATSSRTTLCSSVCAGRSSTLRVRARRASLSR